MKGFLISLGLFFELALLGFASYVLIPLTGVFPTWNVWQSVVLLPYAIGALALGIALCIAFTVHAFKNYVIVYRVYQCVMSVGFLAVMGVVLYFVTK